MSKETIKIFRQVLSIAIQYFEFLIIIFIKENVSKHLILIQNKYLQKFNATL